MKRQFLFLITLLSFCFHYKVQSQSNTYSSYFKEGSFLLLEENYDLALKNFLEAYKIDSSSANINFNVGFAIINSSLKKADAEKYLAKAITNVSKNYRQDNPEEITAPPIAYFYYGRALHNNYKFDEAVAQYDFYENTFLKDKKSKEEIDFFKSQAAYAKEIIASPIKVKIQNLGDSINSPFPDFSPVLSADEKTIIYTTRRNTSTGGIKTPDGQYYEDIVIAFKNEDGKWSSPKSISPLINSKNHEGSVNLSQDGQTLIVYKDDNGNGNLYFSSWDGKEWSVLKQFGSNINSKYWESHGCLSADNNFLYFVSNRPGGFGGRDIYRCAKLPNGNWSNAQNLGSTINTSQDEEGAFIEADGKTLIFSSKGHRSMGGFDIFTSKIDGDHFSAPENIGYPINTPEDDIYFVTSPDGKRGYFSSAKDGGFGEKDIYSMDIITNVEKPITLLKGSVIGMNGEKIPEDLVIIVKEKETGEIVGTYQPKENGTFSSILTSDKDYTFSYQTKGEEFYSEEVKVASNADFKETKKEINLEPVALVTKKTIALNIIVFNNLKEKKPLTNASVLLIDNDKITSSFILDENGKKDGTPLEIGKTYSLVVEQNGKKSMPTVINTTIINNSTSVSQILYFEGKPAKKLDVLLNVLVTNSKKTPLSNTKIFINGNDGNKYEGLTNKKGYIKNIKLYPNVNYDLVGERNGNKSEKILFTTNNLKTNKTYQKTIVIDEGKESENNTALNTKVVCGDRLDYKCTFDYNKIDAAEKNDWNILIDALVARTKECTPEVKIMSSASHVPTHAFANNKDLAKHRADKTEENIKAEVAAKGGDVSKITFKSIYQVRGPRYANDAKKQKKYREFQYVKVIIR